MARARRYARGAYKAMRRPVTAGRNPAGNPPVGFRVLTVSQAAERLAVSGRRVRALITAGRLPAQRMGLGWLINEQDLQRVATRLPGRPRRA